MKNRCCQQEGRTPVQFPAARFITTSIRWIEQRTEETTPLQNTASGLPVPVPASNVTDWDFQYVYEMFTASMDWGSVADLADGTNLDFGSITTTD